MQKKMTMIEINNLNSSKPHVDQNMAYAVLSNTATISGRRKTVREISFWNLKAWCCKNCGAGE